MKAAVTEVAIHALLAERWSPRAFVMGKSIPDQVITSLFEAARWAPSSFNEQPWRYLAGIHGTQSFRKMSECLNPRNKLWAAKASMLVLSLAKRTFSHNGSDNKHAWHDVGAANLSLVLQALSEGLHCHQMAGFDKEAAKELLEISEDFDPVTFIAIGFRDDPAHLPDDFQVREEAPRTRRTLDELVKIL